MNGEKLLYAIGEIDEKFINELDIKQNRKNFTKPILMAASLIIIISGILFGRYNQGDVATDPNGEITPPIVVDEREVDEEFADLPKIAISDIHADGMGYGGVMAYGLEDVDDGTFWKEDLEIKKIPVYKNKAYFKDKGFIPLDIKVSDMVEKLTKYAKIFGIEVSSEEASVVSYEDYELEASNIKKEDSTDLASNVFIEKDGIRISVDRTGEVSVNFSDEKALQTGQLLDFEKPDYEKANSRESLEILGNYILENHPEYLNLENPYMNLYSIYYNIYGEEDYNLDFYENSTDLEKRFLNYELGKKASFIVSSWGNIVSFHYRDIDLSEEVGVYPIISKEKAVELMEEGKYSTSVPYEFSNKENIEKIELKYFVNGYQEYIIPYYEIYVCLPEEELEGDLKSYGIYYVPAVEEEYIENMPTYDGRFN